MGKNCQSKHLEIFNSGKKFDWYHSNLYFINNTLIKFNKWVCTNIKANLNNSIEKNHTLITFKYKHYLLKIEPLLNYPIF
jgi:hypothetical protein